MQLRTHTYSGIKEFLTGCINGHYHLWFLPTLIMVYLIFPIIHEGIHNNSLNVKYCLVFIRSDNFSSKSYYITKQIRSIKCHIRKDEFYCSYYIYWLCGVGVLFKQKEVWEKCTDIKLPYIYSCIYSRCLWELVVFYLL